ncbi:MAG: DUF1579 family protein [Planctomycetes bacterium]|nr:DUF1579 family protein [Planctomycetota bacterium]
MKTRSILAIVALTAMASVAMAQDGQAPAEQDKRLKYFVGDWDVTVDFKLPEGKEGKGKAACHTKAILDGKFIHQEYKSKFMDQPLTVVQILGYDSIKKKFVEFQLHANNKEAHTMHDEGSFSENGKTLNLVGDSIDGFTGKPVKLRTVTTITDDDHYTLEWFITEMGGKEERKVVLKHSRKK